MEGNKFEAPFVHDTFDAREVPEMRVGGILHSDGDPRLCSKFHGSSGLRDESVDLVGLVDLDEVLWIQVGQSAGELFRSQRLWLLGSEPFEFLGDFLLPCS